MLWNTSWLKTGAICCTRRPNVDVPIVTTAPTPTAVIKPTPTAKPNSTDCGNSNEVMQDGKTCASGWIWNGVDDKSRSIGGDPTCTNNVYPYKYYCND